MEDPRSNDRAPRVAIPLRIREDFVTVASDQVFQNIHRYIAMTLVKTNMKLIIVLVTSLLALNTAIAQKMNKNLQSYCLELNDNFDQIIDERKQILEDIAASMMTSMKEHERVNLMLICTHNSRRSHMAQIWIETAAVYYGVDNIIAYSGGTESTAFNKNAIAALERAGFKINVVQQHDTNPVYTVSNGIDTYLAYSKKYNDHLNVSKDFIAIMVCSDADKSCPVVEGADDRFALPFNDPRYYDGTPSQDQKYDETVQLIGLEMFYLAHVLKSKLVASIEATK